MLLLLPKPCLPAHRIGVLHGVPQISYRGCVDRVAVIPHNFEALVLRLLVSFGQLESAIHLLLHGREYLVWRSRSGSGGLPTRLGGLNPWSGCTPYGNLLSPSRRRKTYPQYRARRRRRR